MNIENLINDYSTYIYNYALKLTCHPIAAEDLTQETFIKAWSKLDTLKSLDTIKPWLRKICFNLFLMNLRKEKKLSILNSDEIENLETESKTLPPPTPEEEVLVEEAIKELQNGCFLAMTRYLTLHQRIAFSLVDMFGLSLDETAELLELSKSAVKSLLYRARMNIDSFFHDHCNLLSFNNPCSCKAWLNFSKYKASLRKQSAPQKKLIDHLDYAEKNYHYDPAIRSKIKYLYAHMPDKKPSDEWYQKIHDLIQ